MEDGQQAPESSGSPGGPAAANGSVGNGSNSGAAQGSPRDTAYNLSSNFTSLFNGSEAPKEGDPVTHQADVKPAPEVEQVQEHKEEQLQAPAPLPGFSDINLGIGFGDLYRDAEEARLPSEDGDALELVQWLPTLPQLFVFMALTQIVINFFWFIADCTAEFAFLGAAEDWFQVISWVFLILMLIVYFGYMWMIKDDVLRAITSTIFAFLVFASFFYAPLTSSYGSIAFQATFTFFRCIFIFVILALYAVAYREDIVPPRDHLPPTLRNFVVQYRLDQP